MTPRARRARCAWALAATLAAALPGLARAHDDLAPRREAIAAATTRHPEDLALWLARAELARLARDFDAAEASLARAASLAPGAPALAACRAALALDRGDLATARAVVEPALAGSGLSTGDAAPLELLAARIAQSQGRAADALAHYDRALATLPRPTADAYLARAAIARDLHGHAEAARGLEQARARLPHDGALLDALAGDLAALGRDDEAKALLAGWLASAPAAAIAPRPEEGERVTGATAAVVVRGPWLQNGTDAAITVRWRTDVPTNSRVWIGASPGTLAPAVTDTASVTEHEVRVTGLSPGSAYAYAIGSSTAMLAGGDTTHVFRTAPPPGDVVPTRIWVLGDSGIPGAAQNRVRDAYAAWPGAAATDVWLMLGDNAYQTGTDAEYGAGLFTPYASFLRRHVLWPTRGNHDAIHSGGANDYYDLFTLPTAGEAGGTPSSTEAWYSFDHGDVHFVCLDSEGSARTPGSPMLTWLAGDLAATQRTWTIVYFHHPPYTKGSHDSDNVSDSGGRMRDMREHVMPILEAAGVDLVLAGHSHSYERSFLLDGHYGTSATLVPGMILDAGDGDPAPGGDGAYTKPSAGPAPHEGEVVAVAGSSAQISGGALNHPAMLRSLNVLGSLVIEIEGTRLDARFLDDLGGVRDRFSIVKGSEVSVGDDGAAAAQAAPTLRVAGANPFRGEARLAIDLPRAGGADLRVVDAAGRRVRRLATGPRAAGRHDVAWDGNDESGRRAPAGLYFAILDAAGGRRVVRLLRVD